MKRRSGRFFLLCALLSLLAFLAACGGSSVGTIPSGTPDTGNGTPAVIPSPSPTPVSTAPPSATGKFYAFVRQNQLWVAANGAKPVQVTRFAYPGLPDVFWHQPLWSPGDRAIAFIMAARPVGQGGGGCPPPNYGANGGFYLYNTSTHQLSALTVAPQAAQPATTMPRSDYWQDAVWQDATHLLAWYNGAVGKTSSAAGLYRYDLASGTLTQVIPLSALGATTIWDAQPGLPLLLSLRYSSGQLYYQVVVHPFTQDSQLVVYRRSLAQPANQSSQVMVEGHLPWCATTQGGSFIEPGWDVSLDGEQLAAQVVTASSATQGVSTIQVLNMASGSVTTLFARVAPVLLDHDVTLAWGPDSQTIVATASDPSDPAGLYSATLANPAAVQEYQPALPGQIIWQPAGTTFALDTTPGSGGAAPPSASVYLFEPGTASGRLLLTGVQQFVWG